MSMTDTMSDTEQSSSTEGAGPASPASSQGYTDPLADTMGDALAEGGEGDSLQFFVGSLPHVPPPPPRK